MRKDFLFTAPSRRNCFRACYARPSNNHGCGRFSSVIAHQLDRAIHAWRFFSPRHREQNVFCSAWRPFFLRRRERSVFCSAWRSSFYFLFLWIATSLATLAPRNDGMVISSIAVANTINAASVLSTYLDGMSSLEANFEQIDLSMEGEVSIGKVSLIRPGYFRWEVVTGPSAQLIIINGGDLLIYDRDLEQLIRRKVDRQQPNSPAMLLSSSMAKMENTFKITQIEDSTKIITFTLRPLNKENHGYQWLKFSFKNKILNSICCKNNLGQEIVIKFTNIKVNQKIDMRRFTFNPPPHTDILDERTNNK